MKRTLVLFAAIGLMLAPAALAQGKDRDRGRDRSAEWSDWQTGPFVQVQGQGQDWGNQFLPSSPSQARDAVKEGRALSYAKIEDMLKREYGGYLGRADLYEGRDGSAYYDVVWFTKDGRKIDLRIDALSARVIERRGDWR